MLRPGCGLTLPTLLHGKALVGLGLGDIRGAAEQPGMALSRDPGDGWALTISAQFDRLLDETAKAQADRDQLQHLARTGFVRR